MTADVTRAREALDTNELLVLPSLAARPAGGSRVVLTRKYLSGMAAYARLWPGPVTSLVGLSEQPSTEMDQVTIDVNTVQPRVEVRPHTPAALARRVQSAALVFAGLTGDELPLARLCAKLGVPLVFNSEYTLSTEKQIIDAEKVTVHVTLSSRAGQNPSGDETE